MRVAGGSKDERQRIVLELYATHTCAEIAAEVRKRTGSPCSVGPIKRDVHELAARGLLTVRKAAPRRKYPEPEPRECECGCGETFTPTSTQVRDGFGKYKDRAHYRAAMRAKVEAVAAEAVPMIESGLTLDEIATARPDLPRHRVDYALSITNVPRRRRGTRPGLRRNGRLVQCKAREHDFCPHGDSERWVPASQPTEFLSRSCWARYRRHGAWRSLLGLIRSWGAAWDENTWARDSHKRRFWGGRIGGLARGGRPRGALSSWNVAARDQLANARLAFASTHGRMPSLRELEQVTGVPRSTIARLSQ